MLKLLASSSRILWEKGLPNLQRLTAAVPIVIARCQHSPTGQGSGPASVGGLGSLPKYDMTARLLDMQNGQKVKPTFSVEELQRRLDRLRALMLSSNIDAALFTSYHNINYYCDFLYTSFGRTYGLVVTMDKVLFLSPAVDGGQPWRRTQIGENVVYTDVWQRDNFYHAVQAELAGRGLMTLGVEFDDMTLDGFTKLNLAVPDMQKVDIGKPAMRLRMKKSDEEIALIREGARIADLGGWAVVEALEEGVPEYELAMQASNTMIREVARAYPHGELMNTWAWIQSGINTDGGHNPLTSRRVRNGDIMSLNTFPMIAGYYTALERTLFLNHASDAHLAIWEINSKVHRRGLELIRPGARCCDIAAELNEIYREHGVLKYIPIGYGHSFGSLCHYYGREADLELREDIPTVLEPGMVVSMEPMISIPEGMPGAGGYRDHDILVVTEDGAEDITGFPVGPEHNIIKKT
ncbi:creatinase-like [Branchiostoma floridae]|uniref:Creatinase-like n=1 Tax=Branchiostoma floridae TaxID=7739 RepID=A0A9J7N9D6_BRAFL|nr:creatinase-like [Branchiostoma floridae]XP_035694291.1 creatinase-like [Branchiostoma floridae]